MQIDFSKVEDVHSFASVPEGRYVVKVADVREGTTRDGDERWALRLDVVEGEFTGRIAAWDGLVWSERGLRRVKHVLEKFGYDVSGGVRVEARDLLGVEVVAEIRLEEREDPVTGARQVRPRVPFLGYESVSAVERAWLGPDRDRAGEHADGASSLG